MNKILYFQKTIFIVAVSTIILTVFVNTSVTAQTIQGCVQYTENTARQAAFENVYKNNDFYLGKPKYHLQTDNIKELTEYNGKIYRFIPFKGISVIYNDEPNKRFYYLVKNNQYTLMTYDVLPENRTYPLIIPKYNVIGQLVSVGFQVSDKETFIFDNNRNLIAHWYDNMEFTKKYSRKTIYFEP